MIGRRQILGGIATLAWARPTSADDAAATSSVTARSVERELLRVGGSPQNFATPTELFDRALIPTPSFFVRSHFGPPTLDRARRLAVLGGKSALDLDVEALKRDFTAVTVTAVLQCSGNGRALHAPRVPGLQWVHGGMGQATFTGVRLKDLLDKAGLDAALRKGTHVHLRGADAPPKPTTPAFLRSIPIERALDPTTLVAYAMNGEPLTLAHGAPLRLVVPGWAGDHWVKWLTKIEVAKEEVKGFYMQTAYRMPIQPVEPGAAVPPEKTRPATTFPVKSVLAPKGAKAPRGAQSVAGVAFSGDAAIAKVEVSLDGGKSWQLAALEGERGVGRWNVFRFSFVQPEAGKVHVTARATDAKGNVQPEHAVWNPSGYFWNGWHSDAWEVE